MKSLCHCGFRLVQIFFIGQLVDRSINCMFNFFVCEKKEGGKLKVARQPSDIPPFLSEIAVSYLLTDLLDQRTFQHHELLTAHFFGAVSDTAHAQS